LKSGPVEALDGILGQSAEFLETAHPREFREIPSDAAKCSTRQRSAGVLAEAFLCAVAAGDDQAVAFATALAGAVLETPVVKLAHSVLEGGPLTVTCAIRLAELVLASRSPGATAGAL
jgi:hypothetical protein